MGVVLLTQLARSERTPRSREWFWQRALIVLLCATGVLPSLIDVVFYSHHISSVSAPVPLGGLANDARLGTLLLAHAVAFFGVITSLGRNHDLRGAAVIPYLAPWAAMEISSICANGTIGTSALLWPMVGAYFWLSQTPLKVLDTVAVITGTMAVLGLLGGVLRPDVFTVPESGGGEAKAIIGHQLLAGPFGHPNSFGQALGFGLPTLLLLKPGKLRKLFVAATILALLWTSTRTGIAGGTVGLVVLWLLRNHSPERERSRRTRITLVVVAMVAACVAAVVIPFTATRPEMFAYRGQIWLSSRQYIRGHWMVGRGSDFYSAITVDYNPLGDQAFHGHNLVLHFVTTAGLLGGLGLALLAFGLMRRSIAAARAGVDFPLAFTLAFFVVAILEVTTDFRQPGKPGYSVWAPAAVILLGAVAARRESVAGEPRRAERMPAH